MSGATSSAEREEVERWMAQKRRLLFILGGWSLLSLGAGSGVLLARPQPFAQQAAIQAVAWGAIDGGLALAGFLAAPPKDPAEDRRDLRRLFWINAGLDVLYVAVGASLWAFGKREALRGAGAGVVLQGGFLLAFDSLAALSL